eukprot:5696358-Amphidinium_carterae.1
MVQAAELVVEKGVSCEVIDMQTLIPWDEEQVMASVKKTGRCVIAHEASKTSGFGAELAACIQESCFLHLQAPVQRVCGWDTPFPLAWEELYIPSPLRVHDAIMKVMTF